MSKQDRQGVRSASDLERKYDFSQIAEFSKASKNQNAAISQLTQTLAQFMADTNGKLSQLDDDLQFIEGVEGAVTELQNAVSTNTDSIEEVGSTVTALQTTVNENTESIEEVEGRVTDLQTAVSANTNSIEAVEGVVTELQTEVSENSNSISELRDKKADTSGWAANKYLGTDEEGNLIETDKPTASDIKTEDGKTVEDKLNSVLSTLYPVGAIYVTVSNTGPADLFGGEWELMATGNLLVGLAQETEETLPELLQTLDTCYLWKRTA